MASFKLFFKFKSAKSFSSIPICQNYVSIGELKDMIFERKIGRGRDFDLVITNADTNEEYVDESTLIRANSSVLIRRIPGWPRKPIVLAPAPVEDEEPGSTEEQKSTVKPAVFICDSEEWDEFFASDSLSDSATLSTVDDEDCKIKALVGTPALQRQEETGDGGIGRRMWGRNIPPEGYVCHRCKVPGHYIQHCPTNGDPDYDIKKVKVAILRPDEAAFEKEVEGLPTIQRSVGDLPPELFCKICKKVMEYAVITSKCCFDSFCDQCIRNYIISNNTICVCGATNILADHLLPNLTLRNTINRFLESNKSTSISVVGDNNDATAKIPYMAEVPSPVQSVASNEEAKNPSPMQSVASTKEEVAVPSTAKKDVPVAVHEESESAKNEEGEGGKRKGKNEGGEGAKKKRKKAHGSSDDGKMQWIAAQNPAAQNYMMSMAFTSYNPYWAPSTQPGMESLVTPGPGPFARIYNGVYF